MTTPTLLALDFDGVLCDGLIEYFETAWRAYQRLWADAPSQPPAGLADAFYRMRPVVETGWEMPLVVHALMQGVSEAEILLDWGAIVQSYVQAENLVPAALGAAVDGVRDEWIAADVESWLALHRPYPGVSDRLVQVLASSTTVYIISTKESRFILQLLQQQGVNFPASQIIGKEIKQPKAKTLREIRQKLEAEQAQPIATWFVEDRFKTLQAIEAQPDLNDVELFLADWGYNTLEERSLAASSDRVHLITLQDFAQDFAHWLT